MSLSRDNFNNKTTKYSSDLIKRGLDLAIKIDSYTKKDCLVDDDSLVNLEKNNDELNSFNSDSSDDWCKQGIDLYNAKEYEKALALFNKAIEVNPESELAWYWRGMTLENLREWHESLASFDKAIEINPKYELAWYRRGMALYDYGEEEWEKALASFDKAIEVNPESELAWYRRGMTLDIYGEGEWEKALASFDKAIAINPEYSLAWRMRCSPLCCLERYLEVIYSCEKASKCYEKKINIESDQDRRNIEEIDTFLTEHLSNRVNELLDENRYEEAMIFYDKTFVVLSPNDPWVWFYRGILNYYDREKRYQEAIASFDKIIEIDSKDGWAWYNRGEALYELERYQEAIASFDKALEINPESELAWHWRDKTLCKKMKVRHLINYETLCAELTQYEGCDRKTDKYYNLDYIEVRFPFYGDYVNETVEKSNYAVFKNSLESISIHDRSNNIQSRSYEDDTHLFVIRGALTSVEYELVKSCLESIESYPLLDGEHSAQQEQEDCLESFNSWQKDDILSELADRYDIDPATIDSEILLNILLELELETCEENACSYWLLDDDNYQEIADRLSPELNSEVEGTNCRW